MDMMETDGLWTTVGRGEGSQGVQDPSPKDRERISRVIHKPWGREGLLGEAVEQKFPGVGPS